MKLTYTLLSVILVSQVYTAVTLCDMRSDLDVLLTQKSDKEAKSTGASDDLPEWFDQPELLIGKNLADLTKREWERRPTLTLGPLIRSDKFQHGSFPSWTHYARTSVGELVLWVESGVIVKTSPSINPHIPKTQ